MMIADSDGQFIFKENEFEEDVFVAAAFVAKYRKVSSLESLKDQLMQYSNSLKQQLYDIINRDYKDFITISTKLDGVDTRTLLLQKPLLELKGDLSALHEGVVTGMQAIQEKVKNRLEVSGRRELVRTVLLCMERLDATDAILLSSIRTGTAGAQEGGDDVHSAGAVEGGLGDLLGPAKRQAAIAPTEAHSQHSSQRSRLLRALDRKIASAAAVSGTPGRGAGTAVAVSALLLERDVFVCSELERASFCLAAVDASLGDLWRQYVRMERAGNGGGEGSEESKDDASVLSLLRSRPGLLSVFRTLEAQAAAHKATLVGRIHSQLTHLLTNAVGGASAGVEAAAPATSGSGSSSSRAAGKSAVDLKSRSVAHCLRALCTLRSPEVAEELVRSAVVEPLARSCLTAGRVDGKGGRGSYAGLEDALQSIVDAVSQPGVPSAAAGTSSAPSFLLICLRVGEEVRSYCHEQQVEDAGNPTSSAAPSAAGSHALDLMAHGVWRPVAELVQERFSEMFSVGIPGTLSHCYRCMRQFLQKLQTICGPSFAAGIAERRDAHPLVAGFFAQWKLDLYFQLRCKEVFGRLDRLCDATIRQGLVAPQGLLSDLYFKQESAAHSSPHMAVRDDVDRQLAECGGLQVPVFRAAALELRGSLHPSMLLDPLASKFLTLLLRILMRVEAHVAVTANVTTPSFANRGELEQLRELCSAAQAEPKAAAAPAASSTPAGKRSVGGAATPAGSSVSAAAASSTPGGGAGEGSFAIPVLSMEELVLLCADLSCLEAWLPGEFSTAAASALVLRRQPFWRAGAVDLRAVDAVRSALQRQVGKLRGARSEVWARVGALLGAECKKALGAVKSAVVSKYRMTNKPAPESPSAYVETILAPFRHFMAQFSGVLARLTSPFAAGVGAGAGQADLAGAVRRWQSALLEEVSLSFAEQVSALIETVRQMDSTLQRRSKAQASASSGAAMSDSEKIALQIRLDIEAYGREISAFGLDLASMPAYNSLRELRFEQA